MTRNNSLLNAASPRPDNGSRGIRCIVCEEGSPVCGGAHAEVPSSNRPLRNQLKCSLYRISSPLGPRSCTCLVKDTAPDTQAREPTAPGPALRSCASDPLVGIKAVSLHIHPSLLTCVKLILPRQPSKQGVCIDVNRAVFCVCVGQGQSHSSCFRSCAVSSSAAHRVIPLMQSKHVINGPSQPALFVVRQTLKSNVSTMGGRGILLARQKC